MRCKGGRDYSLKADAKTLYYLLLRFILYGCDLNYFQEKSCIAVVVCVRVHVYVINSNGLERSQCVCVLV